MKNKLIKFINKWETKLAEAEKRGNERDISIAKSQIEKLKIQLGDNADSEPAGTENPKNESGEPKSENPIQNADEAEKTLPEAKEAEETGYFEAMTTEDLQKQRRIFLRLIKYNTDDEELTATLAHIESILEARMPKREPDLKPVQQNVNEADIRRWLCGFRCFPECVRAMEYNRAFGQLKFACGALFTDDEIMKMGGRPVSRAEMEIKKQFPTMRLAAFEEQSAAGFHNYMKII